MLVGKNLMVRNRRYFFFVILWSFIQIDMISVVLSRCIKSLVWGVEFVKGICSCFES